MDEENEIVKFPPHLVDDAIRSVPSTILWQGEIRNMIILHSKRVAFLNFGEGLRVIDPYTKEYRPLPRMM